MGLFVEGLLLGGVEGRGVGGAAAVGFAEGFLKVFFAEVVDDCGGWVDAFVEEVLLDFFGGWVGRRRGKARR